MSIRQQVLNVRTMQVRKNSKWCAWQQPVASPDVYTMFCCDCALCHQFQFRVGKGPGGKPRAQFRVTRANLYTQMKRKHRSERHHITFLKKGEKIVALVDNAMVITLVNGLRRGGARVKRKKRRG